MITDITLTVLRLTSCLMLANKVRSAWLISMASSVLKIVILNTLQLHILASSKCITLILSLYAWFRWQHIPLRKKETAMDSTWIIILLIVIGPTCFYLLNTWTVDNFQVILSTLNLFAYLLAANRKKACWVVWIIYDILLIGLFINQSLYLSAAVTLLYIPIAFFGDRQWHRLSITESRQLPTNILHTH